MPRKISNEELYAEIMALKTAIAPIVETYETVGTLGAWAKVLLATIAVVTTIILGIKNIAK